MMFALNPYFGRTLLDDPFFTVREPRANRFSFHTDIKDTGNEILIEAELPGFKKEELEINLEGDLLTISAEKKEEQNEECERYVRKERFAGSYKRSFTLSGIVCDKIGATFENGLLTLTLPKEEKKEPTGRKIAIA